MQRRHKQWTNYKVEHFEGENSGGHFEVENSDTVGAYLITAHRADGVIITSAGSPRLDQAWLRLVYALDVMPAHLKYPELTLDAVDIWWGLLSDEQREPLQFFWDNGQVLEHVSVWDVFGDGGPEPEAGWNKRERFRWALCDLVQKTELPPPTLLSELVGGVGAHACTTGLVENEEDAQGLGEVMAGAVRASLNQVKSIMDYYETGIVVVPGDYDA